MVNTIIPKVEDSFYANRRFYIVRKIEQNTCYYSLEGPLLTTCQEVRNSTFENHHEIWYIAKHPNGIYKMLGTLRELHDLKEDIIPMLMYRNLNPDENWLIIERIRKVYG